MVGDSIQFAGFHVSAAGVEPDTAQVEAIRNFPAPRDIHEMRAFLGMCNQLASFVLDVAHISARMRQLVKKGGAFAWLEGSFV